jgi:Holliday junction resolvase-like predicted endonuclease
MVIERDLLISLLKLTKNGAVIRENINKEAKLPSAITLKLLRKLQSDNLIYLKDGKIEADSNGRLKLAIKAVELGADVEHVSDFLCWQEFEDIAALALERNGYAVKKNVRFKHAGRRWEIDVVGCRKPAVICIDCKHWHHGMHHSVLMKIVDSQVERVKAFAEALPSVSLEVECAKWDRAKLVPVILSLIPSRYKFLGDVPVVPVLQLQDFLSQLPAQVESLKYFVREFRHL